MHKKPNILNHIILEMKIIQLQLYLAKRSAKKICVPRQTLVEIESHINHSLSSLNHLITQIDDFKTDAELNTLLISEQREHHENDQLQTPNRNGEYKRG
jgi:hypothetical protein